MIQGQKLLAQHFPSICASQRNTNLPHSLRKSKKMTPRCPLLLFFLTFIICSSSPSVCYFVSAIAVCMAIYCFSLILYWIYASCVDEDVRRGTVSLNTSLGVCGLLLFFLLVSGCILKIGRDSLCFSVLHNTPSITSCEDAENKTWAHPYTGNQFYTGLYSTERSMWVSFFFWVLITAVVVIQRRQSSRLKVWADDEWSRAETEPFLHRPRQR
uniref:Transmembrane protein 179B n=1 Tax=Sinocyclocheilus anshuiensis TaxID=1608454 RepID=A0A671QFE4_9TELE